MKEELQPIELQEPTETTNETLLEELTGKIRNEFPELNFSQARLITEGLDNVAVILDEKIVFRFPWTEQNVKSFTREMELLDKIHDKLPLPIPHYEYVSAKKNFGGYEMIQGSDLTPELFETLSEDVKEKIAKQLGEFLSRLHKLSPDVVNDSQIWRTPMFFQKRYLEKRRSVIANGITPDLLSKIDDFYEKFVEINPPADAFIHADMHGRHFLLAPNKTEISGVLDFGEASAGDRAYDFFAFRKYGDDFFGQVLQNYTLEKGDDFINRSHWYLVRSLVDNLFRKIKNGGDTTELTSTVEEHLSNLKK